jgi:hypothetical protein
VPLARQRSAVVTSTVQEGPTTSTPMDVDLDGQQAGPSGLSQRRDAESPAREEGRAYIAGGTLKEMTERSPTKKYALIYSFLVYCVARDFSTKLSSQYTRNSPISTYF